MPFSYNLNANEPSQVLKLIYSCLRRHLTFWLKNRGKTFVSSMSIYSTCAGQYIMIYQCYRSGILSTLWLISRMGVTLVHYLLFQILILQLKQLYVSDLIKGIICWDFVLIIVNLEKSVIECNTRNQIVLQRKKNPNIEFIMYLQQWVIT